MRYLFLLLAIIYGALSLFIADHFDKLFAMNSAFFFFLVYEIRKSRDSE